MKTMFIAWDPYTRRSDLLAQHLGATMHHIYHGQRGKLLQVPVRYLAQSLETWKVLCRERPDVVLVQNPPIFCVLFAFFYAWRYDARYVIDSHTGAFVSRRWRWSLGLHRLLSHRAAATIVHNEYQAEIVKHWDCRYCVLEDPLGDFSSATCFPISDQCNVAVINTFADDEPLDIIVEAADRLTEVSFYVTGDSKRISPRLSAMKMKNCHFTGYLPYDQYVGLLKAVDFVLDLTTREHNLLSGAFEAVSVGTPLIISDSQILRDYFPQGTIHVPNTVEGICEGVRRAQREQSVLQQGILQLRDKLQTEWQQQFSELQCLLKEY